MHNHRDEGYRTRVLLAAIDHNSHLGRKQATTSDGMPKYHRTYRRRTSRWDTIPVLEPKSYNFTKELVDKIFLFRSQSEDSIRSSHKRVSAPEMIAPTIAKELLPKTSEIIDKKKSHFI